MSDGDEPTTADSMLVIVLLELIKELRESKSIDPGRLSDRLLNYADDTRLKDPALRNLLAEIAFLVKQP